MTTLRLMQGPPKSGKSNHARRWVGDDTSRALVCRDSLRWMCFRERGVLDRASEEVVDIAERAMVLALLRRQVSVVVDDCNLNPFTVAKWHELARRNHAEVEIVELAPGEAA